MPGDYLVMPHPAGDEVYAITNRLFVSTYAKGTIVNPLLSPPSPKHRIISKADNDNDDDNDDDDDDDDDNDDGGIAATLPAITGSPTRWHRRSSIGAVVPIVPQTIGGKSGSPRKPAAGGMKLERRRSISLDHAADGGTSDDKAAQAHRQKKMWAKLSTRTGDDVSLMAGAKLDDSQSNEKKPKTESDDHATFASVVEATTAIHRLRIALSSPPDSIAYARKAATPGASKWALMRAAKNIGKSDGSVAALAAAAAADGDSGRLKGRSTKDLTMIISLMSRVAPALLGNLSPASQRAVAREITIKDYSRGSPVFEQGALPDGYYYILAGQVSIYKHKEGENDSDFKNKNRSEGFFHETYGRKLTSLHREQGFGELSFARVGQVVRSATVVADGDEESSFADSAIHVSEASGGEAGAAIPLHPTVCLHVPAHTYVLQVSQKTDEELRRKMSLLESSLLFQHRPLEKLYDVAQHLRLKNFPAGKSLRSSGSPVDEVFLILSGEIAVYRTAALPSQSMGKHNLDSLKSTVIMANGAAAMAAEAAAEKNPDGGKRHGKDGEHDRSSMRRTELALLGQGEIFGIVDLLLKRTQMTRSASCITNVEVLMISVFMFQQLVLSDERSAELLRRLVKNRSCWEELRVSCTEAHPGLSTRMTHETMHIAKCASVSPPPPPPWPRSPKPNVVSQVQSITRGADATRRATPLGASS